MPPRRPLRAAPDPEGSSARASGADGRPRPETALVIGIGNELLRDEGLGIHVARALSAARDALPAWVDVVEAGLALLELAPEMARHDRVILVDAVRAGGEPGTLYRLELEDETTAGLPLEPALSLHQWGLADTLRAIGLMGLLPRRLTVLGAEPALIEAGLDLSPAAAKAARRLVAAVLDELGCGAGAGQAEERAPPSPPAASRTP